MTNDPNGYRTDLSAMQDLIDCAAKIEQAIELRLTEIEKRMTELHVHWTGTAATAHAAAHANWLRAAGDLQAALIDLRTGADHAHATYSAVVATNRRMWP